MKNFFLILLSFFFLFAKNTGAVNLTITCDGLGPCSMSPFSGASLFNEPDIKPGYNIPREFRIINNSSNQDCFLVLGTKNEMISLENRFGNFVNVAPVLNTVIKNGSTEFFGQSLGLWSASNYQSLQDLFDAGDVNLGTVSQLSSKDYYWTVTMDPTAGNEYQGITLKFDFDLVFSCDLPPTPTPTPTPTSTPGPTPTPTPSDDDEGDGDGDGIGGASATPTPSPTSFFTGGFVEGISTFFEEIFPTPTPTPSVAGTEEGENILGEQTCCPKIEPSWWILLILQVIFLTNYYQKKIREDKKTDLIIVSCLTFLAFFISHLLLHSIFINYFGYQESKFCDYFWLLSIISILLINGSYIMIKKENK